MYIIYTDDNCLNKTKIMIFEKGHCTNYNFFLNNTRLEVVKSLKYVGVNLHNNGNWNRTQAHIAQNAPYSLHNLFSTFSNLKLKTYPFQIRLIYSIRLLHQSLIMEWKFGVTIKDQR